MANKYLVLTGNKAETLANKLVRDWYAMAPFGVFYFYWFEVVWKEENSGKFHFSFSLRWIYGARRPAKFRVLVKAAQRWNLCCFYYTDDDEEHFHALWWSLALYKGKWFDFPCRPRCAWECYFAKGNLLRLLWSWHVPIFPHKSHHRKQKHKSSYSLRVREENRFSVLFLHHQCCNHKESPLQQHFLVIKNR